MADYPDQIKQNQISEFVELYKIEIGSAVYYYTAGKEPISFQSYWYQPAAIKRGSFTISQELKVVTVNITVNLQSEIAKYIANSPVDACYVTIYRVFVAGGGNFKLFKGKLVDISIAEYAAEIHLESTVQLFKTVLPSLVIQSQCNNELGDARCGVNLEAYKFQTEVTALARNGKELTLLGLNNSPNFEMGFAVAYVIENNILTLNTRRLILWHENNVVRLQAPFEDRVVVGSAIVLYPGCNKKAVTCVEKFNNFATHFTGFPYVPSVNPVLWGFQ